MSAHTIQDAIEILERLPDRKFVSPKANTYFDGDPEKPVRCCPLWHLALAWGEVVAEQELPDGSTDLDEPSEDEVVELTMLSAGISKQTTRQLIVQYDLSKTKREGVEVVLDMLRRML